MADGGNGSPLVRNASAMFSARLSESISTPFWKRKPTRCASGTDASQRTLTVAPGNMDSPLMCMQQNDLPAPDGPRSQSSSPARSSNCTRGLRNGHASDWRSMSTEITGSEEFLSARLLDGALVADIDAT